MRISLIIIALLLLSSTYIALFIWISVYSCPLTLYLRSYMGPPTYSLVMNYADQSFIDFKDVRIRFRFTRLPNSFTEMCNLTRTSTTNDSISNSTESLLVFVLSSPKKISIRNAIRSQWANSTYSQSIQAQTYNDIISVDLEDNYMNLVYKVSIILHISVRMCSSSFILKIDEDVIFNIDRFFLGVNRLFHSKHSAIYCNVWRKMKPKRKEDNKWYISRDQFGGNYYPPFCSGSSYIITRKAAKEILKVTPNFPLIHVEDVLITGIISQAVHVRRVHLPTMFHRKSVFFSSCPKTSYGVRALLSKHNFKSPSSIQKGWQNLQKECPVPKKTKQ